MPYLICFPPRKKEEAKATTEKYFCASFKHLGCSICNASQRGSPAFPRHEKCLMVLFSISMFSHKKRKAKAAVKKLATRILLDLETSFVPTSLFFRTFLSPPRSAPHRFSMAPDLDTGTFSLSASFSSFRFLCLMQTSSEAGYCVIRISENRYRNFSPFSILFHSAHRHGPPRALAFLLRYLIL